MVSFVWCIFPSFFCIFFELNSYNCVMLIINFFSVLFWRSKQIRVRWILYFARLYYVACVSAVMILQSTNTSLLYAAVVVAVYNKTKGSICFFDLKPSIGSVIVTFICLLLFLLPTFFTSLSIKSFDSVFEWNDVEEWKMSLWKIIFFSQNILWNLEFELETEEIESIFCIYIASQCHFFCVLLLLAVAAAATVDVLLKFIGSLWRNNLMKDFSSQCEAMEEKKSLNGKCVEFLFENTVFNWCFS